MEDIVDPTDEWYVPVFCKSHQEQGLKDFKNGGKNKLFMQVKEKKRRKSASDVKDKKPKKEKPFEGITFGTKKST